MREGREEYKYGLWHMDTPTGSPVSESFALCYFGTLCKTTEFESKLKNVVIY